MVPYSTVPLRMLLCYCCVIVVVSSVYSVSAATIDGDVDPKFGGGSSTSGSYSLDDALLLFPGVVSSGNYTMQEGGIGVGLTVPVSTPEEPTPGESSLPTSPSGGGTGDPPSNPPDDGSEFPTPTPDEAQPEQVPSEDMPSNVVGDQTTSPSTDTLGGASSSTSTSVRSGGGGFTGGDVPILEGQLNSGLEFVGNIPATPEGMCAFEVGDVKSYEAGITPVYLRAFAYDEQKRVQDSWTQLQNETQNVDSAIQQVAALTASTGLAGLGYVSYLYRLAYLR